MNDIENGLTAEETEGKTEEEIRQLVLEKLAAKTTEEIKLFYEMQGLETPSANIVFEILTYEG